MKKTEDIREFVKSLKKAEKASIPTGINPMLATLVNKPLEEAGWTYEIKWDGFRALAYVDKNKVSIRSRNDKPFNERFYPVHDEFKKWETEAVLDGELAVVDRKGLPDFKALQTWRSEADGDLVFFVFDILWAEGYNLMGLPLTERRKILEKVVPKDGMIRISESFKASGEDLFKLARQMNLEGIIAKKENSPYRPDTRTKEWLKIKTEKYQELIIGGYTRNENSSRKISSLLMGMFEDGELVFKTPVGTGFTDRMQEEILRQARPLETDECPFREVPEYNKPSRFRPDPPKAEVTWLKPELVAEISYRTLTPDGSFRHPSFKGLRPDKAPEQVIKENPIEIKNTKNNYPDLYTDKMLRKPGKPVRKTILNPADETQTRSVNGHNLKFTNLGKIFWPEEQVSKRDLINYYYRMAPYILPYISDRPQTMNRFPNGINGKSFYQKDVKGKVPEWISTYAYYSEADQREKEFMVCTGEASLLYLINLGCIEINPWSSRVQKPHNPDWCILDLDPGETSFEQVIEAAQATREVLESIQVSSWCKTSGSKGLHIYIPLGANYTYEESKEFGRALMKVVHNEIPEFTSIERYVNKRKGKLYLDFLQNRPQATVAAPYSLRPKPGATVSMPLHWEEVKPGLKISDFNIYNASDRIKETGDIFQGVLGKGADIYNAAERLEELYNVKVPV